MIYKEILPENITFTTSFLNQLIDVLQEDISGSTSRRKYQHFVTGGVGPGVTSSLYQTVYDQDFTLQTSNPIFDITFGLHPDGATVQSSKVNNDGNGKELFPSSSLMMREKIDIYRQFAQSLLGFSGSKFTSPYSSTNTSDEMDAALFLCFKRLFSRDQIKPETFAMNFFQTASFVNTTSADPTNPPLGNDDRGRTNLYVTSPTGSTIYTDIGSSTKRLVTAGGNVGDVVDAADKTRSVGLVFYDRGVVVLDLAKITSGSQFMSGTIDAVNTTGTTVLGGAGTETYGTAKFIPDMLVSASIDNIIDHIASARFSGSNQTAITFQNVTNINSTLVFCRAAADEFNYSSNPTFIDEQNKIVVIDPGMETYQQTFTFVTSVGLYDANDNLLAVAKLSRPVEKSPERDVTFRLRLDF